MHLIFLAGSFADVLGDVRARIFPSLSGLLTQLIATLFLFLIVKKYLWKPAMKFLEARKDHIAKTVTDADEKLKLATQQQIEAEQKVKDAYKEAWTIIDEAKVNALNQRDEIVQKAEVEAKIKREQADRDIEAEKTRAQKQVRTEIIEVALAAATQVIEREVTTKDNLRLVEDFVKEVDING